MKKYLFYTFQEKEELINFLKKLKEYKKEDFDIYSPHPDEELSDFISKKESPLLGIVLIAGIFGVLFAFLFQIFTNAIDYKTIVGGKSPFSIQPYIPVVFEVMVLFSSLTATLGMLFALNKLPLFSHPLHKSIKAKRVLGDHYALSLFLEKEEDLNFIEKLSDGLNFEGKEIIEVVEEKLSFKEVSRAILFLIGITFFLSLTFYIVIKIFPLISPVKDIIFQPKLKVYDKSEIAKGGLTLSFIPEESIFTEKELIEIKEEEAKLIVNPLPLDEETISRGKEKFSIFCALCHGVYGDGTNFLGPNYKAKPANLHSKTVAEKSDGEIFYIIAKGKNTMPSYEKDLKEEDIFSIINYIKVLRRSQNATEEDYQRAIEEKK